jgi:hypothetical protein
MNSKDQAELQAYLWNRPEDALYSVQKYYEHKWEYYYSYSRDEKILGYQKALDQFNGTEPPVRIVKLSRYLVEGELVFTEIVKIRVQ